MGMKSGDDFTVPLCRGCHDIQHSMKESKFWGDIDLAKSLANYLYSVTRKTELGLKAIHEFQSQRGLHVS